MIHRTRRWITLASAAVVVVALAAGGGWLLSSGGSSRPSADTAGLTGTVWRLSSYTGSDMHDRPVDTATEIYFARDGSFVGDGECAVAGGHAVINGNALSLSDVVVRDKSCTDQYTASLTPQALPVLRGPAKFSIDATSLRIQRAGVGTLEFVPAAASTPPPTLDIPTLVGATWVFGVPPSTLPPPKGRLREPVRLHVADNGAVTGSDGCNTFRASAGVAHRFTISGFTLTSDRRCSPYARSVAEYVDTTLPGRWRAKVDGASLTLTAPSDTLTFSWQPADAAATDPKLLLGSLWRVASVAGEPLATSSASVQIGKDGKLTVQDGCRTQTGTAKVLHGTVVFHGIREQRCAGAVGAQSVTLDSFLNGRQIWSVRNGSLSISGDQQGFGILLTSAAPRQGTIPTTPLGRSWKLTEIIHYRQNGRSETGPVVFTFDASGGVTDHVGDSSAVRVTGSRMSFEKGWLNDLVGYPGPHLSLRAYNFAFGKVLAGSVRWSVAGDRLTIIKPGIGELHFVHLADPGAGGLSGSAVPSATRTR